MKIKKGVILAGLQLPMRKALTSADVLWSNMGKELVVTSGLEGTHSAGSLHYYGYALDFRTYYFSARIKQVIADRLALRLGEKYTVVVEKTHIHVQYSNAVEY